MIVGANSISHSTLTHTKNLSGLS